MEDSEVCETPGSACRARPPPPPHAPSPNPPPSTLPPNLEVALQTTHSHVYKIKEEKTSKKARAERKGVKNAILPATPTSISVSLSSVEFLLVVAQFRGWGFFFPEGSCMPVFAAPAPVARLEHELLIFSCQLHQLIDHITV